MAVRQDMQLQRDVTVLCLSSILQREVGAIGSILSESVEPLEVGQGRHRNAGISDTGSTLRNCCGGADKNGCFVRRGKAKKANFESAVVVSRFRNGNAKLPQIAMASGTISCLPGARVVLACPVPPPEAAVYVSSIVASRAERLASVNSDS